MRIVVRVVAAGGRLRVEVPEIGLKDDMPDLAAYRPAGGAIVALGTEAEKLAMGNGRGQVDPAVLTLAPPFSVEGFGDQAAIMLLRLYVTRAMAALRPGFLGSMLAGLLDSIDYDLSLPQFAKLPDDVRHRFLNDVREMLPHPRRLVINGQDLS